MSQITKYMKNSIYIILCISILHTHIYITYS